MILAYGMAILPHNHRTGFRAGVHGIVSVDTPVLHHSATCHRAVYTTLVHLPVLCAAGWNDGCSLNQTAAYEANMVNLIKDVRKAWKKPALPVTIAASGFDGFYGEEKTVSPPRCFAETPSIKCNCANDRGCRRLDIVRSQFNAANATRHPELGGNVITMETRGYWRDSKNRLGL